MEENKISWARVSKNICYFIAPVFGLLLIACIAGLVIMDTDIELETTTNYYDTKLFSGNYLNSICNNTYIYQTLKQDTEKQEEYIYLYSYDIQENVSINGKTGAIYYNQDSNNNFKYLMIDTKNKIAITNVEHTMKTDTVNIK